jgi:hypothetical protein
MIARQKILSTFVPSLRLGVNSIPPIVTTLKQLKRLAAGFSD